MNKKYKIPISSWEEEKEFIIDFLQICKQQKCEECYFRNICNRNSDSKTFLLNYWSEVLAASE